MTDPFGPDEDQTGPDTNTEFDAMFGADAPPPEEESMLFDPSEAVEFADMIPGTWAAFVAGPPEKKISQNGNAMMNVCFQATTREIAGARIWRNYMLGGKGGGWTKEFLLALDLKEEAEGTAPIRPSVLNGRKIIIKVRQQKDNPEYNEVFKVARHPEGPTGDDSPF